jgi:ribosomal protein S27E
MRSETKQINSVTLNFSHQKNQIACRHCYDTVIGGAGRTVLDDSGTLAITAWTCARCGGVIEEIHHGARRKGAAASDSVRRGATTFDRTAGAGCATRAQELKPNVGVGWPGVGCKRVVQPIG